MQLQPHGQNRLRPQLHAYRSGMLGRQAGGVAGLKAVQSILTIQAKWRLGDHAVKGRIAVAVNAPLHSEALSFPHALAHS